VRDIIDQLVAWHTEGVSYAVATVIRTFDSAPRQAGAAMAVSEHGAIVGSVSGGCVESAIVEIAGEVISTGVPSHDRFGVSDDDAFAVGLTCGGTIDVFVVKYTPTMGRRVCSAQAALRSGQPFSLGTILSDERSELLLFDGTELVGSTGSAPSDHGATTHMAGLLAAGIDTVVHVGGQMNGCGNEVDLFVHSFAPPPRMIVFGAIDFARALVQVGKLMGYHVTLCDARAVFATRERFPEADEIVVQWPHRYLENQRLDSRSVLCVLTHDSKFDVPLLLQALRLPVSYVGAMGSRRTCTHRELELRNAGLTDAELGQLHAPIGLDIGGRTPMETAISIAAEIVASRENRSGSSLRGNDLPIHAIGQTTDSTLTAPIQ